jgi:putative ABC transport system ATP-binding protein
MIGLEASALTKSFNGRTGRIDVLKGVSFHAAPGEIVWIAGASGAGKTTLLGILGLLSVADGGRYRWGGTELTGLSAGRRAALRRTVFSTSFQNGNLFPHLTALENVLVGMPRGAPERAHAALDAANLGAVANRRAATLSGGERQRASIARALARDSRVILADEPTSSLDADNAGSVLNLLRRAANAGTTVIVASHDARVASIVDRRFVLAQGVLP